MNSMIIGLALVAVGVAAAAQGQDRMPPIPADKLTDVQKKAIAEFKAARSADISGPFVPMLRSPEVMNRARALGDYLRYKSALPPRLSEFVILMAARRWNQQYEWNAHQPLAIKGGLSADIVKAIADGRRPDRMAGDEDVVYTLWDEVQRNSVSDATYARAVQRWGEHGVVELTSLVGYFQLVSLVLNVARIPEEPNPAVQPLEPL